MRGAKASRIFVLAQPAWLRAPAHGAAASEKLMSFQNDPMTEPKPRAPVAAAGVACFRGASVLLVRRGSPPRQNEWSIPGGRIEWGERAADAALRELKEETGCEAEIAGLIDVVDAVMSSPRSRQPWGHYVLIDYAARWRRGEPQAGGDVADARFFPLDEIGRLGLWQETLRVIEAGRRLLNE
jgi:8-oxo-dGTP diphosphatase